MNRNSLIGYSLLAVLFIAYVWISQPSQEQIKEAQLNKIKQDSLALVNFRNDSIAIVKKDSLRKVLADTSMTDSLRLQKLKNSGQLAQFGSFSSAAIGVEGKTVLENDLIRVTLSNKGGQIREVLLKKYLQYDRGDSSFKAKVPMVLQADPKNNFGYALKLANGSTAYTEQFYFKANKISDKEVVFTAVAENGGTFSQTYKLTEGSYEVKYDVSLNGLEKVLKPSEKLLKLNWNNYLHAAEKNAVYEQQYSSIYYKESEENPTYCDCRSDDEVSTETSVKWISNSQQFFNSSLIADKSFGNAKLTTRVLDTKAGKDASIKLLTTEIDVPYANAGNETIGMKMFLGPNVHDLLVASGSGLEEIIPFGWSVFGAINRYPVRWLFNFLMTLLPVGLCIVIMTLLVKLALFPLQHKMTLSSVKMSLLKPELDKMRAKFGDDQAAMSQAQMKLYQEYGVNPLGGCLPSLVQMPIWIALYRFFPAYMPFRQESFLWADDLVSYDAFFNFGFEIPGFGSHLSLFTLLWFVSMIVYAWYNSKTMDMSAMNSNPMMKYMPYIFPVVFFFALNSWAAGLTCYMFFSNLFNIGLTLLSKHVLINEEKVKAEMDKYKADPNKKKGKLATKFEEAMKQQQELAAQRAKEQQQNKKK